MTNSVPKYKLKAGRKAVAQLVRAVASADLTRTGALPPVHREEAARALADLHELEKSNQVSVVEFYDTARELREAAATFVEVYSVSIRELVALASAHGQGQNEQDDSSCGTGLLDANGVRCGGQAFSSSSDIRGTAAVVSSAAAAAGPFLEDPVLLLVDSSAVVANSLWAVVSTNTADSNVRQVLQGSLYASQDRAATCGETRKGHVHSCGVAMVSALLRSDALPALSRLLSAEAQRGPARALLTPRQLTTCLKPLSALLMAAHTLPDVLLPADPPSRHQPRLPSLNSPATASPTPTTPSPTPDRTPNPTPGTTAPPAACPSATTPAAASPIQALGSCPTPHAAAGEHESSAAMHSAQGHSPISSIASPAPSNSQPHQPQTLAPAVLTAAAESGVVEAACRAAVGAVVLQGGGGQHHYQQQGARSPGGDRSTLLRELLTVLLQVHDARACAVDRDEQVLDLCGVSSQDHVRRCDKGALEVFLLSRWPAGILWPRNLPACLPACLSEWLAMHMSLLAARPSKGPTG